jgi:hypothetical protein
MASKNDTIEQVLTTALMAYETSKNVKCVYPGLEYEPVAGTSYIQVDFLPASPITASIGYQEQERMTGIYQLKVYTDGEDAQAKGYQIEADLNTYFKKGVPISFNGTILQIDAFYGKGFDITAEWTVKVISVAYRVNL